MEQRRLDEYADGRVAAVRDAQQVEYVAYTGRHPSVTDAWALGYTTGVREDCSFQIDSYPNVSLPVLFLDNDFHDPDPDRFLDRVDQYEPEVVVIGDAMTAEEAVELQEVADDLEDTEPVIVPKCRGALDEIDTETVVGYANGYSEIKPDDFSKPRKWRGRRVHLLGGSPSSQYQVIQQLTQPMLDDAPPADITGLDGNCAFKVAYKGEYWTPRGWQAADHLSIRETVERSLEETKRFWQQVGVWPDQEPRHVYGPVVEHLDEHIWLDRGGDPIPDRDGLERSYVEEYEGLGTVAFESEQYKRFVEAREGWQPVD